jgi:hypothetical protein
MERTTYMPIKLQQREPHIAANHAGRSASSGAHQAMNQPGFAGEPGSHPPGDIRNVRERTERFRPSEGLGYSAMIHFRGNGELSISAQDPHREPGA